jgi:DNA-binding beta-propeller fold protein YncE
MKKLSVVLALALTWAAKYPAQQKAPLRLVQTVPVPEGLRKAWDHFGVDLKGHRLFVASEEDPAVEVFDIRTNKHIRTLIGFKGEPHNILLFPEIDKFYVVDGGGEIKIFDYNSYELIGHIELTIDADTQVYDPATKYLYVVNGGREAHTPYCLISVVDTRSGKKLADMRLETNRLESMTIEKSGPRLFVNMTGTNEIGVVDREKRALVQTWPITAGKINTPMQYDEATHRLFVATRTPSTFVVVNTDTGKEVTSLAVAEYADDLSYDSVHHRIYVACGGGHNDAHPGAITVIEQRGADDYQVIANVPTKAGAQTGRLVPELNRYYSAVPGRGDQKAEILVFDVVL